MILKITAKDFDGNKSNLRAKEELGKKIFNFISYFMEKNFENCKINKYGNIFVGGKEILAKKIAKKFKYFYLDGGSYLSIKIEKITNDILNQFRKKGFKTFLYQNKIQEDIYGIINKYQF